MSAARSCPGCLKPLLGRNPRHCWMTGTYRRFYCGRRCRNRDRGFLRKREAQTKEADRGR